MSLKPLVIPRDYPYMQSIDLEFLKKTYLYQPGPHKAPSQPVPGWDPAIRELLAAGYSFLPLQYSKTGYLFRGLRAGLKQGITSKSLGHSPDNDETSRVEQAMGVYFFSHEISDALTASALHEENRNGDNAIMVIKAGFFNHQLQNYHAAVLAIGDTGFVFRYPFVTRPIRLDDIDYIITASTVASGMPLPEKMHDRHIHVPKKTRQELEHQLRVAFDQMEIKPACPVASDLYPRRA